MSKIPFSYKESDIKTLEINSKNLNLNSNINNIDKRNVTIHEYEPDKKYEISIYKFIDILNSIEMSKNALDICNKLGCNNLEIRQKSLDFGLTYKNIFSGDNNSYNAKKVLSIINCDVKPKINVKTYKSICYIKWKIYEINLKNLKNKLYDNINIYDNISEWIGVLAGLLLYFDELDNINYNNTRYSFDICKSLTVNDI